jgi:NADH-quinone oxidoreductase subunit J
VTWVQVIFLLLSAIAVVSGVLVVTTPHLVHAALWLVVTLGAVAGVYLVLAAEFVAWVQVLIYVGAIVVLLLFGLMLTRAPIGRETLDNQQRGLSALVALALLGGLALLLWDAFGDATLTLGTTTTRGIGESLFRSFLLPFEVVSFLLLAALVGAIVLARRDEDVTQVRRSAPPRSFREREAARR